MRGAILIRASPEPPSSGRHRKLHGVQLLHAIAALSVLPGIHWSGASGGAPVHGVRRLNLYASFECISVSSGEEIRIVGLYHQTPGRVVICVRQPISQWIRLTDHHTTLYYPEEGRAFRFGASSPLTNPFYMLSLGMHGSELDLSRIGLEVKRKEVRGDTLITHWSPPGSAVSPVGGARMSIVRDRLAELDLLSRDGSFMSGVRFSDYRSTTSGEVPFVLEMVDGPTGSRREEIRLGWLVENGSVPDSIASFEIPSDVPVEDLGS